MEASPSMRAPRRWPSGSLFRLKTLTMYVCVCVSACVFMYVCMSFFRLLLSVLSIFTNDICMCARTSMYRGFEYLYMYICMYVFSFEFIYVCMYMVNCLKINWFLILLVRLL